MYLVYYFNCENKKEEQFGNQFYPGENFKPLQSNEKSNLEIIIVIRNKYVTPSCCRPPAGFTPPSPPSYVTAHTKTGR